MSPTRQIGFWVAGTAAFFLAILLLRDIMLPFVAGMAIAYFFDPVVDKLEERGASRAVATTIVTGLFFTIVLALLFLLVPVLQSQIVSFAQRLPHYAETLSGLAKPIIDWLAPIFERLQLQIMPQESEPVPLREAVGGYVAQAVKWLGGLATRVLTGGAAVLNLLSLVVITPVVAFYLLRDWDLLVAKVDSWLPRKHLHTIREQAALIDETLAGFARGQATVCLVLGGFYAIGLSLVGLDFGLVVGLGTGLISFIPYIGMLVGFVIGTGMALVQFSFEIVPVAMVIAVFIVGQVLEGNFLTPKLVGERIGLHPVWVLFALLAGGALFGFVGVLLAMPVAAVIGVLMRFALGHYLQSPLYLGPEGRHDDNDDPEPS